MMSLIPSGANIKPGNLAAFNTNFVKIVGQHSCLWNYNSPEYFQKDVTEKAWSQIAVEVHDTVPNCQIRWKSIRQAFARSLKPSFNGGGQKKDYYLASHLGFIIPYLRCCTSSRILNAVEKAPETHDESIVERIKVEDDTKLEFYEIMSDEEVEEEYQRIDEAEAAAKFIVNRQKADAAVSEWLHVKRSRTSSDINSSTLFLQSLQPFLDEMTSKQNRRFRRKVMSLIDDVLDDKDE